MVESSVRFISVRNASELLSISRAQLYRWIKDEGMGLPKPVRLGPRKTGFLRNELEAWIESRQRGVGGFASTRAAFAASAR